MVASFSEFMKQNKKDVPHGFYAATDTLCDKDGNALVWEFRKLSSREAEDIRKRYTKQVQVTGKPNLFRPEVDAEGYTAALIAASCVYPALDNAELQDSYGVKTPTDLLLAMVDSAGEYTALTLWFNQYQGFNVSFQDKVRDAKN